VKIGLLTTPFYERSLDELVPELAALGVRAVELGTGNHPGEAHCPPDRLLDDTAAQDALLTLLERHEMTISALSQHGNPLHPRRPVARAAHDTWRRTVALAEQLGVPVVNAFSGCPGDSDAGRYPSWVTYPWPPENLELSDWQWRTKVIPYWREEAAFAARHGIRVAIEMHPGFVVYNPHGLLRLRAAAGDNVGANFDPSHLLWQGIEPVEAIRALADHGALFHVHAKDVAMHADVLARKGLLDLEPLEQVDDRSWTFRTLGLGHDRETWARIIDALRRAGYDDVVSIEHEDERLDTDTAIRLSVEFLTDVLHGSGPAPSIVGVDHTLLEGGRQ
jgi:sugar phosphate isomerase/epimerase